jgi:hypothetical protein
LQSPSDDEYHFISEYVNPGRITARKKSNVLPSDQFKDEIEQSASMLLLNELEKKSYIMQEVIDKMYDDCKSPRNPFGLDLKDSPM